MNLKKRGRDKFLPTYREHMIELSNNTIMRVAVCLHCKEKLISGDNVSKIADTILQKHKKYWRGHNDESPKEFEKIKVVDPNTSNEKYLRKKITTKKY